MSRVCDTSRYSSGQGSRLLLGLLFSGLIALVAYRRRSLNKSGVVGAIASGTSIFAAGGWSWGMTLVYFFVSSSLLSHYRQRDKAGAAADKFSKGSRRDLGQVAANGGLATGFAILYGLTRSSRTRHLCQAGFTGALAAANADTWATELGVLSASKPRLITSGRPVAPGTSGGITMTGMVASSLGAYSLGLFFRVCQRLRKSCAPAPPVALISGLAGSLCDSLLGATVQAMYYCPVCQTETERRIHRCGTPAQPLRGLAWMNNDVVNFLATACGSVVAIGLVYPQQELSC